MRTRRALVGAVVALCAMSAAPAQAASKPEPPGAVVATDGTTKLQVGDTGQDLCLAIGSSGGSGESCDTAELGTAVAGQTDDGTRVLGAAVPATAATIEVRRAAQLLATAPTVAGEAYTGKRAGTLRFALVRLPKDAPEDGLRVRAFDAKGTLVAVLAVTNSESDLVVDRQRLVSGRSGPVRWSITIVQSSALQPSILDLGHETLSRCIEVSIRSGRSGSTSATCFDGGPLDVGLSAFGGSGLQASVDDSCSGSADFRLLSGIVDATVRRVVVLLGDGTRRTVTARAVGDGRHVAYGVAIPRAAAVRSVTLDMGAAGSKVVRVAAAPLAVRCAAGPSGGIGIGVGVVLPSLTSALATLPPVTPAGPVTTIPGSPPLRVADGPGDSLCVAVGERPFTALGCGVVSPLLSAVLGTYDDVNDPHAFAIVLPAAVATLRIAGPGGKGTRDIPTLPGTGYSGPYAGHVRFAAASIADVRELALIEYLDAAGKVLHREGDAPSPEEFARPKATAPQRIAGRPGAPSLWQTVVKFVGATARCLALTNGPKPAVDDRCRTGRTPQSVLLDSDCATHRLTVAVAVASGTRVFASTGPSRVRPIRLRRGAGLLTLPAGRGLRSLTFVRKGRRSHVRIGAPAGARQCGWKTSLG